MEQTKKICDICKKDTGMTLRKNFFNFALIEKDTLNGEESQRKNIDVCRNCKKTIDTMIKNLKDIYKREAENKTS